MRNDSAHAAPRTLAEVVYTPENELRTPLTMLRGMWRDALASRELAWQLMARDIRAQYRQSLLGVAWAFLPPLALAAGLTLARNAKFINPGETDLPYPAYVMFSLSLWQTFVEALTGPPQAVTAAKQMLARINFPREAILLAKLGEVLFNFAVKLILIAAVFVWYQVPVGPSVLLAFGALASLILLGIFLGTLLAPLGLLYQDVTKGLTVVTGLWLLLTPVIYPIPSTGTLAVIAKINPVTPLLVTTRELATTGRVSDPSQFFLVSALTVVGVLLAWVVFRVAMPFAIERVSS